MPPTRRRCVENAGIINGTTLFRQLGCREVVNELRKKGGPTAPSSTHRPYEGNRSKGDNAYWCRHYD